jgi:hypothetical protein
MNAHCPLTAKGGIHSKLPEQQTKDQIKSNQTFIPEPSKHLLGPALLERVPSMVQNRRR